VTGACPGRAVVLLGPSGSGKSTLLNILGGLDTATSGRVVYGDQDLTLATEQQLTSTGATRSVRVPVLQPHPEPHGAENVSVVTEIARDPMRPEDAWPSWGSASGSIISRPSSRAASSSASPSPRHLEEPAVLLCDRAHRRPDSETGIVVLEALERVNRELGTATIIITHNADIAFMADRVIHLSTARSPRSRGTSYAGRRGN